MDPSLLLYKLEFLLTVPNTKRDGNWADNVCLESAFVHINVWKFCPKREIVREIVIPSLREARRQLLVLARSNKGRPLAERIVERANNVRDRLNNLERNYLCGKPSAFIPDSTISKLDATAG